MMLLAVTGEKAIRRVEATERDHAELAKIHPAANDPTDATVDYTKVVVTKPWGYEYLIFQNGQVAVWIMHLKPGTQTSLHCHRSKKTALVVLEGEAVCSILHEDIPRVAGEGLMIAPLVFHQTKAASNERGVFVMEIESPIDKHDLLRARDEYGRVGKGYETVDKDAFSQNYNYLTLSEPEVYYNVTKRFGQCTVMLKRLEAAEGLNDILALNEDDVLSVLKGAVCDAEGKALAQTGDTMTVADLKAAQAATGAEVLELLVIKKHDTIVKLSDEIIAFLKSQGVREVFFVPGDANVHLIDSLGRAEKLQYTCCQTERVAAMAAEAYSKLTGELGVLLISSGASGTNSLTGVADAWVDSAPLLVISGQASVEEPSDVKLRQRGNKSLNIVDIVSPITKYAVTVQDPKEVRSHLERAAHLAREARQGPVWVDIPIDIQGMTMDQRQLRVYEPPASRPVQSLVHQQAVEVISLLKRSERPVVLAGNGIRLSSAVDGLLELLDVLPVPVLTSRRGADLLPADHSLFFGRPGAYGQRCANFIIQNADLLISVGARLSIPQIGRNYQAFARSARKVLIDIDTVELRKKTVHADVAIEADAGEFLERLRELVEREPLLDYSPWLARCQGWKRTFPPSRERYRHREAINPYLFVEALSEALREEQVVVVDGGLVMNYCMQMLRFKRGQRMISSTGIELPGFALPGAIGACVGNGRQPVICLCEDRGFQVNIPELQTIIDNQLPIKIFILKSKGQADIRKIQREYFGGRCVGTEHDTPFGSPDLSQVGKIYGFRTFQIKQPEGLKEQIGEVLASEGSAICEIQIDGDHELIPRIVFNVNPEGKWEARPLEDMYPFLDRETLDANMISGGFEP